MSKVLFISACIILFFSVLLIGCSNLNKTSVPNRTSIPEKEVQAPSPKTYCVDNTSWEMILYLLGIENQGDPDYAVVDKNNFKFIENVDGTAKLSGEVRFVNGSDRGFTIEVNLSGKTTMGVPKFSSEVPSSTNTSNWYYYSNYTGTLTGVGNYQNMVLSISSADGEPIQIGTGANLADIHDFGLYIWTEYKRISQGTSVSAPVSGEADFHIKLIDCSTAKASLGNKAWLDTNNNGIQDTGENGFAGVEIDLYDGNDKFMTSTTTDANGNYLFNNLAAGNYSLDITLPKNDLSFTLQNKGTDDAADSDVNPESGRILGITLSNDENNSDWDIGIHNPDDPNCPNPSNPDDQTQPQPSL